MASGSSGRPGSAPKGFDFASNDILCSYEDYSNQDSSNGSHSDLSNPNNDFQKSRISRSSVFPTANVYSQPEDSLNSELLTTVERTMKKYSDNLMRFLEGISSRLSQLELYCYNLDKSIGEMRSDLVRDHGDADSKLKSLEKHLQEVHRSVQILRDKQELAETHKELAKLQLAQKESSAAGHDERTAVSAAESKKTDDVSDSPNTQLALALPSQVAPQSSHASVQQQAVAPPPPPPPPAPSQNVAQVPPYYMPSNQLPNPQAPAQPSYLPTDAQYRTPQLTPSGPQPSQTQVNQPPQAQQFPQYQQWPHQVSQPLQQPQPPPMQQQTQMRPPTPQSSVYSPYMGGQPANPPPPETMASSMPMQVPFPGMPPQGMSHAESMPYGYGGANRPGQLQPPSHMKSGFPSQPGDGYPSGGSHPTMSGGSFMLYDNEGARTTHHAPPARYTQAGYPPPNQSLPTQPPPSSSNAMMIRGPGPQQFARNHPYNELIEKLVNMGYRGDHVVSVIQRLEESGQPVDFNAVLDRLNAHSSGGSQRGW